MKKLLAIIIAAIMVISLVPFALAEEAPAAEPESSSLLAHYTFDGENSDKGLTKKGTGAATYKDGVVRMEKDAYFVSDVDLAGLKEITIGVKVVMPKEIKNNDNLPYGWVYGLTSKGSYNTDGQNFAALGIAGDKAISWFANGDQWGGGAHADYKWKDGDVTEGKVLEIVATYKPAKNEKGEDVYMNTLYVNGEKIEGWETSGPLSAIIGDTPTLMVGRNNWGGGEYITPGLGIDKMVVMNVAVSDDDASYVFKDAPLPATPPTTDDDSSDSSSKVDDDTTKKDDDTTKADDGTTGSSDTTGASGSGSGTGSNPTSPTTGFVTFFVAAAAIGSGAYIVSKKRNG